MTRWIFVALWCAIGCGGPGPSPDPVDDVDVEDTTDVGVDSADADATAVDLASCEETIQLAVEDRQTRDGSTPCVFELRTAAEVVLEVTTSGETTLELDGVAPETDAWLSPRAIPAGSTALRVSGAGDWSVEILTHGQPVDTIERERSLVWIDPGLLDDTSTLGLGRLMAVVADGDNPGELFASWLRRFATTAHSERVGLLQYLEQIEGEHGDDPALWDLDALNFVVTGVHNRLDLADRVSCGELRVSVASTDPVFQPFHAIFLFAQPAGDGDVAPHGEVHCGATERRWARLSELDDAAFHTAARDILDEALRRERFLMIETVEFIISPWEWRQWLPTPNTDPGSSLTTVFENPPLFQTVHTSLNSPGAARDDFLRFVEENAAALDARTLLIPERFRPRSARVNATIPWIPLQLDGVDPQVAAMYPDLRRNIEIAGCPACHATDADFIQTRVDRTFSPFYDKELDARADYLDAAQRGLAFDVPFGPLQPDPVLPP